MCPFVVSQGYRNCHSNLVEEETWEKLDALGRTSKSHLHWYKGRGFDRNPPWEKIYLSLKACDVFYKMR